MVNYKPVNFTIDGQDISATAWTYFNTYVVKEGWQQVAIADKDYNSDYAVSHITPSSNFTFTYNNIYQCDL